MFTSRNAVTAIPIPVGSVIPGAYADPDLADAYSIEVPAHTTTDPERIARFIFSQRSFVVDRLMAIRDAIVGHLGLKTTKPLKGPGPQGASGRIGIFRIYGVHGSEIILGEDDAHLDFRLSIMCRTHEQRCVVLSTVVHCHTTLGRIYIRVISPFHRAIIKGSLRRAARAGWPVDA